MSCLVAYCPFLQDQPFFLSLPPTVFTLILCVLLVSSSFSLTSLVWPPFHPLSHPLTLYFAILPTSALWHHCALVLKRKYKCCIWFKYFCWQQTFNRHKADNMTNCLRNILDVIASEKTVSLTHFLSGSNKFQICQKTPRKKHPQTSLFKHTLLVNVYYFSWLFVFLIFCPLR